MGTKKITSCEGCKDSFTNGCGEQQCRARRMGYCKSFGYCCHTYVRGILLDEEIQKDIATGKAMGEICGKMRTFEASDAERAAYDTYLAGRKVFKRKNGDEFWAYELSKPMDKGDIGHYVNTLIDCGIDSLVLSKSYDMFLDNLHIMQAMGCEIKGLCTKHGYFWDKDHNTLGIEVKIPAEDPGK